MKGHVGECWALTVRAGNSGCSARQRPWGDFNIALLNSQEAPGPNPTLAPTVLSLLKSTALHNKEACTWPLQADLRKLDKLLETGWQWRCCFPTAVGTLQLILSQSKPNINLSVLLPILREEICIGNYLSDVNICKHHSHMLVHMEWKNIIKVPAIAGTLLSGAAQLSHQLSRLLKSSRYQTPRPVHCNASCCLLYYSSKEQLPFQWLHKSPWLKEVKLSAHVFCFLEALSGISDISCKAPIIR